MRALWLALAGGSVAFSNIAHAQPMIVADSGDNGWMLAASLFLVVAALPGAALLYARERSALALMASFALAALLFAAIGYSLAFSAGTPWLGDAANMMLADLGEMQPDMTISGAVYAMFELAVALFAVAIVAGAVAGPGRSGWTIAFTGLWLLIVYVPVAHWLWGGGWLAAMGALDYGGGIVVQIAAGVSVLAVAPLLGRGHADVELQPAQIGGAALLGIASLALIGGSSFGATGDAADAMLNALLAACSAMLAGLLFDLVQRRQSTAQDAALFALAGLAAVSAGAGYIAPIGAILLGVIGAAGAHLCATFLRPLALGSPARAFVAHGGGAVSGALLFPVFVLPTFGGPGFDDGTSATAQMLTQAIAVGAIALWAAIASVVAALMVGTVLPMSDRRAR